MSKSLDNYIGLTDSPKDMFGKTMSIPDTLIPRYLQYAVYASPEEVERVTKCLTDGTIHPRTAKVDLAKRLVSVYHGSEAGEAAFAEFERIFVKKDIPDEIPDLALPYSTADIVTILTDASMAACKSEARRLITQGGVSIDGTKITDPIAHVDISSPVILRVGKLRFVRLIGQ